MAWKRIYRCAECGYEAETYEGKGLFGQHITPVSCPDCHTIQNLVVGGVIGDVAPCPKCGGTMADTEEKEFWT